MTTQDIEADCFPSSCHIEALLLPRVECVLVALVYLNSFCLDAALFQVCSCILLRYHHLALVLWGKGIDEVRIQQQHCVVFVGEQVLFYFLTEVKQLIHIQCLMISPAAWGFAAFASQFSLSWRILDEFTLCRFGKLRTFLD